MNLFHGSNILVQNPQIIMSEKRWTSALDSIEKFLNK